MAIQVEIADRVAVVTLDDASRRNALSQAMVADLTATFDRLEEDDGVGAVVVTGAPPAFCAGADLSDLGGSGDVRSIYEGFLRVGRSPLPTVAAVNGAAVGAGMNLAMVCDVRLAARAARFDTRFLKLGLHPGGGHTWMLQRLVGPQAAAAMVLFDQVLDGEQAQARGLVWRCFEDEALRDAARDLAARSAAAPPALVRRTKATMRAVADNAFHDEALSVELDAQMWSMQQPEFRERLRTMRARTSGR